MDGSLVPGGRPAHDQGAASPKVKVNRCPGSGSRRAVIARRIPGSARPRAPHDRVEVAERLVRHRADQDAWAMPSDPPTTSPISERPWPMSVTVGPMGDGRRRCHYVGPPELLGAVRPGDEGRLVSTPEDVAAWLATRGHEERAEPFTFVVGLDGALRLAPRRSEHVACAGGAPVLSAGEITFAWDGDAWTVSAVSNQSTGYCPDPDSWPAVDEALDRAGLTHPGHFTDAIVFRRCPRCRERNVVKDDHFVCAVCDADLPRAWNLDPREDEHG